MGATPITIVLMFVQTNQQASEAHRGMSRRSRDPNSLQTQLANPLYRNLRNLHPELHGRPTPTVPCLTEVGRNSLLEDRDINSWKTAGTDCFVPGWTSIPCCG